jgi:hypothetical protein
MGIRRRQKTGDRIKPRNIGKMEYWSIGKRKSKNTEDRRQHNSLGMLEYWNNGIVVRKERGGNFPEKVGEIGELDRGAIRF